MIADNINTGDIAIAVCDEATVEWAGKETDSLALYGVWRQNTPCGTA